MRIKKKKYMLALLLVILLGIALYFIHRAILQISAPIEYQILSTETVSISQEQETPVDEYLQFSRMINNEYCDNLENAVNQLAVIIPEYVDLRSPLRVEDNYDLVEIVKRAVFFAYPQELVQKWEKGFGYEIPLEAIRALLDRTLLTYDLEVLLESANYVSESQTLQFAKENIVQIADYTVTLLGEPLDYNSNTTARYVFEDLGLEYHGENIIAYLVEIKNGTDIFKREIRLAQCEEGIKLATIVKTTRTYHLPKR